MLPKARTDRLLVTEVDDEVVVNRPKGRMSYTVLDIAYELPETERPESERQRPGGADPDDASS